MHEFGSYNPRGERGAPPDEPPIEAVTLDAAGTILELRLPVGETYARVARRYGADPDPERVDRKFRELFAQAPPLAFPDLPLDEVRRRERTWWKRLVAATMKSVVEAEKGEEIGEVEEIDDFDAFFDELYETYATGAAWRTYADVPDALPILRERGLRLGVLSNFDSRLELLLQDLDLARWFDAVTVSSLAGAAKPDPAIFELALASLDVPAESTVHVGDTPRDDVEGALAAGLRAVLLERDSTIPIPGTGALATESGAAWATGGAESVKGEPGSATGEPGSSRGEEPLEGPAPASEDGIVIVSDLLEFTRWFDA